MDIRNNMMPQKVHNIPFLMKKKKNTLDTILQNMCD